MFIQTEQTPNPATLKFLPGRTVLEAGTADFANAEEAECRSPLASHLFGIEGVAGVFLGADFISITKSADKEWHVLKPSILGAIMEHMTTGLPIIADVPVTEASQDSGDDSDVVVQIKELLETRVRRLKAGKLHAQSPISRTTRTIGNVTVEDETNGVLTIRSKFQMIEYRRNLQRLFGGTLLHGLAEDGDSFVICWKKVELVNCDSMMDGLNVPF